MRYLNIDNLLEIDRLTLAEYELRMTAHKLKKLDELESIHHQAWANNKIKATKLVGKKTVPIYDKFNKFFDKEALENEILGIKDKKQDTKLVALMKKANS